MGINCYFTGRLKLFRRPVFLLYSEVKSAKRYEGMMMVKKLSAPAELPDEADLRAVLAYNMRLFRVNKGWSQEELARQCGLDRTYVSAIERKRWNIALSNIEKIALALGVPAYQLLLPPQARLEIMSA